MKRKDMQLGTPLFFEAGTASWRNSVHGDGVAYVLDDENSYNKPTYRFTRDDKFNKVPGVRGNVLIVTFQLKYNEDEIPAEVHALLSTLRPEHLTEDGNYWLPKSLLARCQELGISADIKSVPAAQLKGEWVTEVASRRGDELAAREHRAQARRDAEDRKMRWSKITYFLSSLNGNYYYKEESSPRVEVRLEDMEKIMKLLHEAEHDTENPGL